MLRLSLSARTVWRARIVRPTLLSSSRRLLSAEAALWSDVAPSTPTPTAAPAANATPPPTQPPPPAAPSGSPGSGRKIGDVFQEAKENEVPFQTLQGVIHDNTLKALVGRPFQLENMSPVQAAVLPLLPQLAEPHGEGSDTPRDLLVKARTGTGKTLGFLIPALEARLNAIEELRRQSQADAGLRGGRLDAERAVRQFAKNKVGTLILSPTRELATQIANEAVRLSYHHKGVETRLFVGGVSKGHQMREWHRGRRDFVVATPGRIRDLLNSEPGFKEAFDKTQVLVLDEADTLHSIGFKDDIADICTFLPPTPERQTFLFSATLPPAVQQIARETLDRRHKFINCVSDVESPVHAHVEQYHTVVPRASDLIPHLFRLITHDQLTNPGKSKIIVFLPTTRLTMLFATIIRTLANNILPAGRKTEIYEIHSRKAQDSRTNTSSRFRKDESGASILVTSDVSARGVDYPNVTRVIQVGIPASTDHYVHRVGRTGRRGLQGRGDLVVLPWEIGFLSWQLTDIPLKPLTTDELVSQVTNLSKELQESGARLPFGKSADLPAIVESIETKITEFLPQLDPEAVNETFTAMLGYYFPKSVELRCRKEIILEGCKEFTTQALGLDEAPYVSKAFLARLGMEDGRTKKWGQGGVDKRRKESFIGRFGMKSSGRRDSTEWNDRGGAARSGGDRADRGDRSDRGGYGGRTRFNKFDESTTDLDDFDGSKRERRDPDIDPGEFVTGRYGNPKRDYQSSSPRRRPSFSGDRRNDFGSRNSERSYGRRGGGAGGDRDGGEGRQSEF